eukprot:7875800-Alexandrium_andersonii.AAC.1
MSASLVGSEMCIRDRSQPESGGPRVSSVGAPPGAVLRAGPSAPGPATEAVSYTHLTAADDM